MIFPHYQIRYKEILTKKENYTEENQRVFQPFFISDPLAKHPKYIKQRDFIEIDNELK